MKNFLLFITISLIAISCRKTNVNSVIAGQWIFRTQFVQASSSPGEYGFPYFSTSITMGNNSPSLIFNSGTFTLSGAFSNAVYNSIPNGLINYSTTGNYSIFQDTLLIIHSDTALLKSTYSYYVNAPFPYGDTIYFRTVSADSLYFLQKWSTLEQTQTNSVTRVYYRCLSGFKRIN